MLSSLFITQTKKCYKLNKKRNLGVTTASLNENKVERNYKVLTSWVLYSPLCLEKHLPNRKANPISNNSTTAKIPEKYRIHQFNTNVWKKCYNVTR